MADGRARSMWDHTAQVLAMLANGLLAVKRPLKPADFHPFAQITKTKREPTPEEAAESFAALRALFCGR